VTGWFLASRLGKAVSISRSGKGPNVETGFRAQRRRRPLSGIRASELRLIVLAVVPAVIFYLALRYYPVLQTFVLSLTDAQLVDPTYDFVGLDNFSGLFADPIFVKVLINTTVYAISATVITMGLGLGLALLLESVRRGSGTLRLIYFLPQVTSAIAIAIVWAWLFQPRFGLFNQFLELVGLPPVPWLVSSQTALPSLVIMAIWGSVGFTMLVFFAGLKGIPAEFVEAARIDGASTAEIVRYIKLPLLSRVTTFVAVTNVIASFQVFQQIFATTKGGPLDSTRVLALEIYQTAFERLRIGEAASVAVVLFVIVAILTVVQLRVQRRDWEF